MRRFSKVLGLLLVLLAGLSLSFWFGGRLVLSRSLARTSGQVNGLHLAAPVDISFDARGIPRIRAKTSSDVCFALGYVHASERLFQMELVRRLARGSLSEVFGEKAYTTDVRQRQIGFGRKANRDVADLSPASRALLERYVEGINAWVENARALPPEFVILRFRPRPWTPTDCLAIALYQTWFSHELMDRDEAFQRLVRMGGPDVLPALGAPYPWSPSTVPASPVSALLGDGPFPLRMTAASNSWAIAPARTASGKAIHASDPHLAINQAPGLWYLASLRSGDGLDVVGVTQPGLPLVLMGHNARIAFSFTVASVDIIDYYDEEIVEGEPREVMTPEGPRALEKVTEEVRVKGESAPRRVAVEITPHGPLLERHGTKGKSMHWAGFDFSAARMLDAGLLLERASGFDEFRQAVTSFGALDANWVYSDREGNIGYQLGVPVPVRDYPDTFARQPGAAASSSWKSYRSLEETPHVLNPAQGWVASCNNQPVGPGWPYPLPGFYDPYRITRAAALLGGERKWTRQDAERMQLDRVSGLALRWKGLCADGAAKLGEDSVAVELRGWDGTMSAESRAAGLFELCWIFLAQPLFEDELGADWKTARSIQEQVLSGNGAKLVDDRRTPQVETKEDIAAVAMKRAIEVARGRPYGDFSTLTVAHPLSSVRLLDTWLRLSRGPVPLGGDPGALDANFTGWDERSGQFRSRIGPSMRFVMDWADPDAFTISLAFGQSGHPLSPHYDDFFLPSLKGERWTVPASVEKQDANEASRLRLLP